LLLGTNIIVRGTTQIQRMILCALPVRDDILPSETAFLMTVETPLKSTGRQISVRFTAQRLPSILPSQELTPPAPSLRARKNVLLLVNAFIVFNLHYHTRLLRYFKNNFAGEPSPCLLYPFPNNCRVGLLHKPSPCLVDAFSLDKIVGLFEWLTVNPLTTTRGVWDKSLNARVLSEFFAKRGKFLVTVQRVSGRVLFEAILSP